MSNLSDNAMDTDYSSGQVELNHQTTASNSSCVPKRRLDEDGNVEMKKIKIEKPMPEQASSMTSNSNCPPVRFVKASSIIQPVPEMTDEEILAYTLEFERKHNI